MPKAKGIRQKWRRLRRPACVGFSRKNPSLSPGEARPLLPYAFRLLTLFFRLWLAGGWQTALCATALAVDAGVRFALPKAETAAFAAFVTGGALVLYCGRYAILAMRGGAGEREEVLRAGPVGTALTLIAGLLLSGYGMVVLPWRYSLWTAAWGLSGVAYCFPVFGRPWREYGLLKPALLALSWTAITCGPPAPAGWTALAGVRLLWIFGMTLAFDAKDVAKDREAGVKTPAVTLGANAFRALVGVCLTAGLIGKLLIVPAPMRAPVAVAWFVSLLMLAGLRGNRSTRAWVLLGDGAVVVYALVPPVVLLLAA